MELDVLLNIFNGIKQRIQVQLFVVVLLAVSSSASSLVMSRGVIDAEEDPQPILFRWLIDLGMMWMSCPISTNSGKLD